MTEAVTDIEETVAAVPAIPAAVASVLSAETFDVNSWLADTSYAGKIIEVFNNGDKLAAISELEAFIRNQNERRDRDARQLVSSITDEDEVTGLITEAEQKIDALMASLIGTGMKIYFRGVAPKVREILEEKTARGLKPKAAVYEEIDGEKLLIEEGHSGGKNHPDFSTEYAFALTAATIIKLEFPNGATDEHKHTVDEVKNYKGTLHGMEYRRIANAAFDANFHSYEIDGRVTVDF